MAQLLPKGSVLDSVMIAICRRDDIGVFKTLINCLKEVGTLNIEILRQDMFNDTIEHLTLSKNVNNLFIMHNWTLNFLEMSKIIKLRKDYPLTTILTKNT